MKLSAKEARKKWPCPLARTFSETPVPGMCRADECPAWRWSGMFASDPRYIAAVKAEMQRLADKHNKTAKKERSPAYFQKAATARVAMHREAHVDFTEDDTGYCGLGGAPV